MRSTPPAPNAAFLAGLWPVMLTPFRANGGIDWPAFDELTDWYIEAGAAGLFAVCLSSEMFELTPAERLALARRAVERAGGRVPVVATGTFGAGPEFARRMAGTGVAAVVCLTNFFEKPGAAKARWTDAAAAFIDRLDPNLTLGLYECPVPHKRLVGASEYLWALRTGRFALIKDTSCETRTLQFRLRAGHRGSLRLFNANTPTLLASLRWGADGYSGIAANFVPRLYAWLCANWAAQPATAERLHRFLTLVDPLIASRYPLAAKYFLHAGGMRIAARARRGPTELREEDRLVLDAFRREAAEWHAELHLADPIFRSIAPPKK